MAAITHQCPHADCLTERMNFEVQAISYGGAKTPNNVRSFAHLSCRACGQPSAVELRSQDGRGQLHPSVLQYPATLEQMGWTIMRIWPEIPKPKLPEYLPEAVVKPYLAAERTFGQKGLEEASAGSYGRALDVGTKLIEPEPKLALYGRINKLAADGRITTDLASWAHAIRLIRNGAMHEIDEIDRDELIAIRGFTELMLTYLFTLPGMLKARQDDTTKKP